MVMKFAHSNIRRSKQSFTSIQASIAQLAACA